MSKFINQYPRAFMLGTMVGMFTSLPTFFFMTAYIAYIPKAYDCSKNGRIDDKILILCETEYEAHSFLENTELQWKAFIYRLEEIRK